MLDRKLRQYIIRKIQFMKIEMIVNIKLIKLIYYLIISLYVISRLCLFFQSND